MHPKRRQIFAEFPAGKSFSVEFIISGSATIARVASGSDEISLGVSDVPDGFDDEGSASGEHS
ncbi:hypothetical protein [Streptomyces sp. NPDC086787]|uniref:hypothetical protein n=1 Tax=Streptomyces sp. NPDC086787 TaxID=3365759 RepID=UPI00382EEE2E